MARDLIAIMDDIPADSFSFGVTVVLPAAADRQRRLLPQRAYRRLQVGRRLPARPGQDQCVQLAAIVSPDSDN